MSDHVFRISPGRLKTAIHLVKDCQGEVSQLIAGGFWNITTNAQRTISLTLKNAAGSAVTSTVVRYGVFEYKNGNTFNFEHMKLVQSGIVTTDGSGGFVVNYLGTKTKGDLVYIGIIHSHGTPVESLLWTVAIS